MARVAPPDGATVAAATVAAPATVGVTVAPSAPSGKLSFQINGLPGGQKVSIPIFTAVAAFVPARTPVFAARITSSVPETNFANNGLLLIEQIVSSTAGGGTQPAGKPVPPQIFQNPAAVGIVQQRPPRTPTPTATPAR
jgi:hypothetical protein